MKKKLIITSVCIAAAFILLFPFGITHYNDGGTVSYKSLTYEVIKWHKMYSVYDEATGAGTAYWVNDTDVYVFPFNLRDNVTDKDWDADQLKFVKTSELETAEDTKAAGAPILCEHGEVIGYEGDMDLVISCPKCAEQVKDSIILAPEDTDPLDPEMQVMPGEYFDAELDFSIYPAQIVVDDSDEGFFIDVTTEIASGGLGYWGSSTVLGADVRVVLHNSGGAELEQDPLDETKDLTYVKLVEGDKITVRHSFSGKLYPGTYDVYVEWYGQTTVFRDAVVINGIDTGCLY